MPRYQGRVGAKFSVCAHGNSGTHVTRHGLATILPANSCSSRWMRTNTTLHALPRGQGRSYVAAEAEPGGIEITFRLLDDRTDWFVVEQCRKGLLKPKPNPVIFEPYNTGTITTLRQLLVQAYKGGSQTPS